ncbi:hypothetical protein L6452_10242 [Arctium lappa]|uniref:Uncharacterized protein n=1 Tax=Arctium lappa TaxID=4217 RepID=A0ACB9DLW9_ARCLA|nr:hypothetical protein L6452_10242 [Arctium lappa]
MKRRSLTDISEEMLEKTSSESGGVICFSQISNSALAGDDNNQTPEDSDVWVKIPRFVWSKDLEKGFKEKGILKLGFM